MANNKRQQFQIKLGKPLPLGVRVEGNTTFFSTVIEEDKECYLNLYYKGEMKKYASILLDPKYKTGNIYSVAIEGLPLEKLEYRYEVKGREFVDPFAQCIVGRSIWGKCLDIEEKHFVRGSLEFPSFDWEGDEAPGISYQDMILYRLHPRGFTKHSSSKVKHKGTFLGIIEKLPYLKELGINAIECMPVYDFNEIIETHSTPYGYQGYQEFLRREHAKVEPEYKINYWGYSREAFYFAPKASYAATQSPITEFKELVKACHKEGIEVILEFHFPEGTSPSYILDCFRYWVSEYHVDGFRFNDNAAPSTLIGGDPYLSKVKLMCTNWNTYDVYRERMPMFKNLAEYNEGFLVDIRRFLKGDEEQTAKFANQFKSNPAKVGKINYITNTNGFTLVDLYSYDVKHNEKNGEDNRDGTNYNYSWNCGKEGPTKRKKVVELREKQIRNALVTLLFSQGTPLLLAGDEFGNTQHGNNNAYCQDNEITWLNWNQWKTNQEQYEFVKWLIQKRKEHPILHTSEELRVMDYISCGYPDLSYHGTKAWYPDYSNYSRVLGIMLCGKYVRIDRVKEDEFFYFAFNMHWEAHNFDLPDLPTEKEWMILLDTSEVFSKIVESGKENNPLSESEQKSADRRRKQLKNKSLMVKPRSIMVLISQKREEDKGLSERGSTP